MKTRSAILARSRPDRAAAGEDSAGRAVDSAGSAGTAGTGSGGLLSPLILGVVLALFSLLVTWRFPVYFHWDDVTYLKWAQAHPNPLSAFRPSESILFGTFRPLNVLTWWVLYRLFEFRAPLYQVFVTFLYHSVFVLYLLVVRRLHDERTAWFSVLGYGAIFFPLTYVMFWFSDLTFILELFWINLSLFFLVSAFNDPGRRYLWGIFAYFCAVLTKEPSVPIVGSCLLLLSWARWRRLPEWARRRTRWLLPLIVVTGAAWILLSPVMQDRQGIGGAADWNAKFRFAATRWSFYARDLVTRTGLLVGAGALFLGVRSLLPKRIREAPRWNALLLLSAFVLSLALRRHPGTALLLVAAAVLPVLRRRRDWAIGWAWGFLPLLALLALKFYIRTYLLEASFGFALVFGVAANEAFLSFRPYLRRRTARYFKPALVLALLGAIVLGRGLFQEKLRALTVLSANRQNFRDVSDFLLSQPQGVPSRLALIHYGDMDYSYRYGVRFLPDEQKGGLQKTMEPYEIPVWFKIRGHSDVQVYPRMQDFMASDSDTCWVWAMNNHEKAFLMGLSLKTRPLYEVQRRGEAAGLYRVERSRP